MNCWGSLCFPMGVSKQNSPLLFFFNRHISISHLPLFPLVFWHNLMCELWYLPLYDWNSVEQHSTKAAVNLTEKKMSLFVRQEQQGLHTLCFWCLFALYLLCKFIFCYKPLGYFCLPLRKKKKRQNIIHQELSITSIAVIELFNESKAEQGP